jgi:hypothetical protein
MLQMGADGIFCAASCARPLCHEKCRQNTLDQADRGDRCERPDRAK